MAVGDKKIVLMRGTATAADVGAVSKAGDTMTGALAMRSGDVRMRLSSQTFGMALETYVDGAYGTNQRTLVITHHNQRPEPGESLRYNCVEDGVGASYTVHHEGNKPTGSYTGNGGSVERTIAVGGIGHALFVWSAKGWAVVASNAAVTFSGTGAVAVAAATFGSGNLKLSTISDMLNASGVTYYYQVL